MNCYDSYDFQTCLNLFRINMIRIDTILKYVKTWRNTQKNLRLKYSFKPLSTIWFSNMSQLVQIQYDTNCYDSIQYKLLWFIWFSNMFKLVQNQCDMNWYNSIWYELLQFIWFSNVSKLVQIQMIYTILKHV